MSQAENKSMVDDGLITNKSDSLSDVAGLVQTQNDLDPAQAPDSSPLFCLSFLMFLLLLLLLLVLLMLFALFGRCCLCACCHRCFTVK